MVSSIAIFATVILQCLIGVTIFVEQNQDRCSPGPDVSALIFLFSILDLLSDVNIFPVRYMHLPFICQVIAEIFFTIYAVEFSLNIVWCSIERLTKEIITTIFTMIDYHKFYIEWEWYLLGSMTLTLSLIILIYVIRATDHLPLFYKNFLIYKRKFQMKFFNKITKNTQRTAAVNRQYRPIGKFPEFALEELVKLCDYSYERQNGMKC